MNKRVKPIGFLFGTLLVSGCATTQAPQESPPTLADDPAIQTIQTAVEHIKKQNRMLVQIEQGTQEAAPPPSRPPQPEFEALVYLRNWNGSAHQAINRVAEVMGYRVQIIGEVPAIEPTVSIDADGVDTFTVLNDLAAQGERHFDLRVNPGERLLTVAYGS